MSSWWIGPALRKSCLEREIWGREDDNSSKYANTIVVDTGWRTSIFALESFTETDDIPDIDLKNRDGINLAEWGRQKNYDVCAHGTVFGGPFSYDIMWPDTFTAEQIEDLNNQIADAGTHTSVLEGEGYSIIDVEYWLSGPLEIEPRNSLI